MLREVELQPASADEDRDDTTLLPSPSPDVARPSRGDGARRGRVLAAVLAKEPLLLWTVVGVALGVAAGLVARAAARLPARSSSSASPASSSCARSARS